MDPQLNEQRYGLMLSRWSAILCGTAVALGTFLVVTMVWLVLVASGHTFFSRNLDWFILGTALGSAVVAGFVAGYVEDWRSASAGLFNGLAAWGLIIVFSSVFVLPNFLRPMTRSHDAARFLAGLDYQMMVVLCCAYGGGLILAAISASFGAKARRPASLYQITPEAERRFLEELNASHDRERVTHTEQVTRDTPYQR